ncbi:hypothetical protein CK203_055131 [Vitis vinifera]|uniref:Uncharacterized protein n=1 Tax=Vitis vinifera TaxID=29760 RepID=A0A438GN07_VITVI|nr:hypothetical protein CK203_055131 [Vitis vinifera]
MLGPTKTTVSVPSSDNSALAACGVDGALGDAHGDTHNTRRSGNLWCEHCQRSNHNRENCWKLYGKPQNWKDNKGNRNQLEQLYKLLTPSVATVSPPLGLNTSFLAQKGSFSAHNPDSRHIKVKIVDGSLATDARTGSDFGEEDDNLVDSTTLRMTTLRINKHLLQGKNGRNENFWDLFQIITPTPFPVSKPKPESNKTPTAQTNTLEQPPLNTSITQPISLKNLPTISPNQPATTISLKNLSTIAPNQPAASEPSQFQSTVATEPSQLQPTAAAEPS